MLDDNYKGVVSAAVACPASRREPLVSTVFAAQRPDKDVMPMCNCARTWATA